MIEMLRLCYKPPTRPIIGGDLLDSARSKIIDHMKTDLDGRDVTVIQDGWSDIHNTPVISGSVHAGEKFYFISAIDTSTNRKTADYCASFARDTMKIAAESFGCNVTAVVTDTETKMNSMSEILTEDNPSLTVYGCSSHWLNLLGQVINQIVEVNKYFGNHDVPGALLSETTGSVKPQLPNDTCWNSQLTCVDTYSCAQNEGLMDLRLRNLVHKVGLYNEAKHLEEQLKPIAVADVCEQRCVIPLHTENVLEHHKAKTTKRFNQAMIHIQPLSWLCVIGALVGRWTKIGNVFCVTH